jgi:tripartite-type tricarboxylate transporter receptor subunit TctC
MLVRAITAIAAALISLTVSSLAQDWPSRSVRIVSPYAAGGASEIVGNVIAESLSKRFNHRFLVENEAGRSGQIGSLAVARAAPDGYTFLLPSLTTHVFSPLIARSFNPVADFTNVAFIGGPPVVLAVHPSLNVHSLSELTAVLRRRREPWRYVSSGVGTLGHLLGEYWAQKEGLRLAHARHDGPGQSTDDLIAGRIPIGSITATTALLRRQELILLAVSSARRLRALDGVPTFQELGYADLVATSWYGVSAPRRLPVSIATRMNEAMAVIIDDPMVQQQFTTFGFELDKKSPEEFSALVRAEVIRWAPLLRGSTNPKQEPKQEQKQKQERKQERRASGVPI